MSETTQLTEEATKLLADLRTMLEQGGQFIANSENTVKGGSVRWEPRPKTEFELARDAEIAAYVEKLKSLAKMRTKMVRLVREYERIQRLAEKLEQNGENEL